MNQEKLVSIVSPCYNAEKYLDNYFKSILSQTYKKLEVIIVNDGSKDRSGDIIESYRKILESLNIKLIAVSYEENRGQAYALNEGLKYVTGDYLTWPDVDDEMVENCIEKKVSFLDEHVDCDYCVCDSLSVDGISGNSSTYRPQILTDNKSIAESIIFSRKGYFVCGAYMVRRVFFDRIVPNREIFTGRGGQNAQMLIPITWFGKYGYINEVLYIFYTHADSHSHRIDEPKKHIQQLRYFEDIIIHTIENTKENELLSYIPEIKRHYSRLRFGHSLDSKDVDIIKECANSLKELGILTTHDRYLVFRYTNKLAKTLFPV